MLLVCVLITAVPITKLFAWGEGDRLRETTSRGLSGLVCPSRTLLHHCGWGSRKACGDAESVPRAPPLDPPLWTVVPKKALSLSLSRSVFITAVPITKLFRVAWVCSERPEAVSPGRGVVLTDLQSSI
jgi:hypothetical protein